MNQKKGIWIVVLLVFIAAILLFIFITNQQKYELAEKKKCGEESNKYVKTNDVGFAKDDTSVVIESRFDRKLNTCLARVTSSGFSIDYTVSNNTYSIIDIYSNQILASYTRSLSGGQKVDTFGDVERFNQLLDEHFSN